MSADRDQAPTGAARQVAISHNLATLNILPPASSPSDVIQAQRSKDKKAAARLKRWVARDQHRRKHARVSTGQYLHFAGPVTISGMNRQRISQTRKENYNDKTFGSIPRYSEMRKHLNYKDAHRALYDPKFKPAVNKLTDEQKMATALAVTVSNVSEGDKIPAMPKLIRALARRYHVDRSREHPLDPSVNPAVIKAPLARDLTQGRTPLKRAHMQAIDDYASDSSDEEDENFALRHAMLVPNPNAKPSAIKKRRKGQ